MNMYSKEDHLKNVRDFEIADPQQILPAVYNTILPPYNQDRCHMGIEQHSKKQCYKLNARDHTEHSRRHHHQSRL